LQLEAYGAVGVVAGAQPAGVRASSAAGGEIVARGFKPIAPLWSWRSPVTLFSRQERLIVAA